MTGCRQTAAGRRGRAPLSPCRGVRHPKTMDYGDLDAPNCSVDLVPMELRGDKRPLWVCPECGLVSVT